MTFKPKVLWERAIGWSYDLPPTGEEPDDRCWVETVNPSPNYFDDIYLELPRKTISLRGFSALIGIPGLCFCVGLTLSLYWDLFVYGWQRDWLMSVFIVLGPPAATVAANAGPGINGHEHEQGKDIEQQNAQRHRVDGLRQHALRVLCLACGNADHFDPAKSEHHNGERSNHPTDAITYADSTITLESFDGFFAELKFGGLFHKAPFGLFIGQQHHCQKLSGPSRVHGEYCVSAPIGKEYIS